MTTHDLVGTCRFSYYANDFAFEKHDIASHHFASGFPIHGANGFVFKYSYNFFNYRNTQGNGYMNTG